MGHELLSRKDRAPGAILRFVRVYLRQNIMDCGERLHRAGVAEIGFGGNAG